MFIDTHCHFDFPPFSDHAEYAIAKSQQAGVEKIIVPAVSSDLFGAVISLAQQHQPIYCALGLHPIYSHTEQDLQLLTNQLQRNLSKLVAIGEIGLDSYIEHADLDRQCFFLQAQFALANQYELPVILHSRRTHARLLKELKRAKLPCVGVVHGFAGSYEEAMQFIRLGYYIGVGGVISYARAKKTRDTISRIPLEYMVLETDAPDMPLSGYQGQANRPENIVKIFDILTELRSEPAQQICAAIFANTLTLFPKINTIANSLVL